MNNEQRASNKYQVAAIVLAAGSSSRMSGLKKEYQKLENSNLTVLGSAVSAFAAFAKVIVIAVPENGEAAARQALPQELFNAGNPEILFVNGGNTRRASVFNALSALVSFNPCYVLIHDGARPRVSISLIENIIAAVEKYDAVIPALPMTDTPKLIERREKGRGKREENKEQVIKFVKNHMKRENIYFAQTPQAFRFPEILRAHEKAAEVNDEEFTDDAEIWGKFIGSVAVVPGEPENRKITFPEDLKSNIK